MKIIQSYKLTLGMLLTVLVLSMACKLTSHNDDMVELIEIEFLSQVKHRTVEDLTSLTEKLAVTNSSFEDELKTKQVATEYYTNEKHLTYFLEAYSQVKKKDILRAETVSLTGKAADLFLDIQSNILNNTDLDAVRSYLSYQFDEIYTQNNDLSNSEKNILLAYITLYQSYLEYMIKNFPQRYSMKAVDWKCAAAIVSGAIAGAGTGGTAGVQIGGAIGKLFGKRGEIIGAGAGAIGGLFGGAIGGGLGAYVFGC